MLRKIKQLTKRVSIFKAHSKKIFASSVLILISCAALSSFYFKIRINKKYKAESDQLVININKMQADIKIYKDAKLKENEVLSDLSKIKKANLFVKDFDKITRDEIFNMFIKFAKWPVEYTILEESCAAQHEKLISTRSGKCMKIIARMSNLEQDETALKFDTYIKNALPGFVFPIKVNIDRQILQDYTRRYNAEFEYSWIYFTSNI